MPHTYRPRALSPAFLVTLPGAAPRRVVSARLTHSAHRYESGSVHHAYRVIVPDAALPAPPDGGCVARLDLMEYPATAFGRGDYADYDEWVGEMGGSDLEGFVESALDFAREGAPRALTGRSRLFHLQAVEVHPAYRQQGIARWLLVSVLQDAHRGAGDVTLLRAVPYLTEFERDTDATGADLAPRRPVGSTATLLALYASVGFRSVPPALLGVDAEGEVPVVCAYLRHWAPVVVRPARAA